VEINRRMHPRSGKDFEVGGGMGELTCHTSHVTRYTSHVTRHTSHVTRHTSHVTQVLYDELEVWRLQELERIKGAHSPPCSKTLNPKPQTPNKTLNPQQNPKPLTKP